MHSVLINSLAVEVDVRALFDFELDARY